MADLFNLKGKTVFLTGGGRGIGRSIALSLGRCGANVTLTYTSAGSEAAAKAVAEEIQAMGFKAMALMVDVKEESQVNAAIEKTVESFGGLYGVVNNAGVTADGLLLRYKTEDFDKVLDTNLKGAFLVCRAAARYLMKNKEGSSIVNIGSVVGEMGNPGQVAYCASKAGMIGMTKSLARELAARQVRANVVAPGFIGTEMTDKLTEDQKKNITANIALGTLGDPEDISNAVLFLLSPMSKYVTGTVLDVNGGLYM